MLKKEQGSNMQNSDYLISENPLKALVFFSLPMIIGNLFQQVYTMADSAIVGRLIHWRIFLSALLLVVELVRQSLSASILDGAVMENWKKQFIRHWFPSCSSAGCSADSDCCSAERLWLPWTLRQRCWICPLHIWKSIFWVCHFYLCTMCCPPCSMHWENHGFRYISWFFLRYLTLFWTGSDRKSVV